MEDSTEQGPVDGPSLNGFAFVGAVAVDALLADVNLPASEIGWCGFHGVGVYMGQFAWVWVIYDRLDV